MTTALAPRAPLVYPCDYVDKGGLAVTDGARGCSGTPTWQLVVHGAFDPEHVRAALADVAARYPSLRTRVHALDGAPAARPLGSRRFAYVEDLAFSGDAARGVGLTPQQHQALLAILGHAGETPMTVGALAERLLLKHHSTVELVDRLGELDLVRRATATDDRRKVTLRLTDKARKLMTSLSSAHLEELRRIRPVFAALIDRLDV